VRRFATALLVDHRGWLLLQERDEHAPIDPDRWGLVGGHVEPAEDLDAAVLRELAEETGMSVGAGELTARIEHWRDFVVHDTRDDMAVYVGATEAGDADVVCGEGRQIVFVDPAGLDALALTQAADEVIGPFLASQTYLRLRASLRPSR
jgi:8-oxo-dGTP diphosphatase